MCLCHLIYNVTVCAKILAISTHACLLVMKPLVNECIDDALFNVVPSI